MKVHINYDLMETITEAKKGFSLEKGCKRALLAVGIVDISMLPYTDINSYVGSLELAISTLAGFGAATATDYVCAAIFKYQKFALEDLYDLLTDLKLINISTNMDLLLESEKYKTEYKLQRNRIPRLHKTEYINIKTYDKIVSIMQEHIVGTNDYYLSRGKPARKKALKLAFNPA